MTILQDASTAIAFLYIFSTWLYLSIEQHGSYAWSSIRLNRGSHNRDSGGQESNSSEVELHDCEDMAESG